MRNLTELDDYRSAEWEANLTGYWSALSARERKHVGAFIVPSATRSNDLRIMACAHLGWDHVSISCSMQDTPTWAEMEQVKRMFFKDTETAMQLHVPPADHKSFHDYTLHLWRPRFKSIPRPPIDLV